mmetsp:Transcript_103358/g.287770  ORF Transcript_103358/g.287770 Transcript_103358/m.287770 type:complete len:246 (-) Transcript_103358:831-1568(-)
MAAATRAAQPPLPAMRCLRHLPLPLERAPHTVFRDAPCCRQGLPASAWRLPWHSGRWGQFQLAQAKWAGSFQPQEQRCRDLVAGSRAAALAARTAERLRRLRVERCRPHRLALPGRSAAGSQGRRGRRECQGPAPARVASQRSAAAADRPRGGGQSAGLPAGQGRALRGPYACPDRPQAQRRPHGPGFRCQGQHTPGRPPRGRHVLRGRERGRAGPGAGHRQCRHDGAALAREHVPPDLRQPGVE